MTFVRGPRRTDQAYIGATWSRSLSGVAGRPLVDGGGKPGRAVSNEVDAVMDRPDTRALIRHRAGDMDAILGWIVFVEGAGVPVIHYCYTRKDFRERGIATELLQAAGVTVRDSLIYTSRGAGEPARKLITAYPIATYLPLADFLKPPEKP